METDREQAARRAVQRRRQQAHLTPEERKRLNAERRNEYKRQQRAKTRDEQERQARGKTERNKAGLDAWQRKQQKRKRAQDEATRITERQQQEAQRRAEQAHRAMQTYVTTSLRNGGRWKVKEHLPQVVTYSHDGQWVQEAPLGSLVPHQPEDAEAMRAWSQQVCLPHPDLLVRGFVLLRERRAEGHKEREQKRRERWEQREEALQVLPERQRRLHSQRPLRPRAFKPPRAEMLVAAALDGAVRGAQYDPFYRTGGRLTTKSLVWDHAAACTLVGRLIETLEAEAHKYNQANLAKELAQVRWRVEDHMQAVQTGEVRLVASKQASDAAEQAFWDEADWSLENLDRMLSAESFANRMVHLEREAQWVERIMSSAEEAISRLDASGAKPEEVARLRMSLRREGGSAAIRRLVRARRLHERRGGVGEVVEPREEPDESESGSARLWLVRDPLQHPDIIWDE